MAEITKECAERIKKDIEGYSSKAKQTIVESWINKQNGIAYCYHEPGDSNLIWITNLALAKLDLTSKVTIKFNGRYYIYNGYYFNIRIAVLKARYYSRLNKTDILVCPDHPFEATRWVLWRQKYV